MGLGYGVKVPVGVHRGLGGLHDFPNPGDILCSALAACADSSLRQIAGQLDIEITKLTVSVAGDIDLRGTLCVSKETPVGFQQMSVRVDLELAPGTMPKLEAKLLAAAEHCCVVLQTLRNGVPVTIELSDASAH
ncbi:MAG: OsmC family peroxiredoxin [Myxococcales bacterium]|nr:MAG: OsmC family peroxiredoxin [Myxococcales bacterium]